MTSTPNLDVMWHGRLADAYLDAVHTPCDPVVATSYRVLNAALRAQYGRLSRLVRVNHVPWDPYTTAEQMFSDLDRGVLYVYRGHALPERHPMLQQWGHDESPALILNDLFRAVHDYYGHWSETGERYPFGTDTDGRGFIGEEHAFMRHREMLPRGAWLALTCETRAQVAVNNFRLPGSFCEQKACRLPEEFVYG